MADDEDFDIDDLEEDEVEEEEEEVQDLSDRYAYEQLCFAHFDHDWN